ncbi:MAG: class II aldolase/adducin family protein [Ignavibacteriales bacterium]|nr:MAG: class II aldolase/adducin family protein [Ignavibacteriales bacterium]
MKQSLFTLKQDIVEVGKRMYARGYVASNDGNISARLDDNRFLVTPTGVSKGFMKPEDLIVVNIEGKVLSGIKKPSSEVFMHLQVYKDRPDVNSVCHAHPPYATGFAVAGIPLDKCVLPEVIITLGSIPLIEYGTPGTEELYRPATKLLKDYDAFLLANHGALTVGTDVINAYHKMETLEHFAQIAFVANQLGYLNTLNKEQVQKLKDQREKFGIRTTVGCVTSEDDSRSTEHTPQSNMMNDDLIKKITDEVLKQIRK